MSVLTSVLVADDDPSIQSVLRELLELDGHEVRVAGDGHAALLSISDHRPDVMVLDIMMPVVDGLGVLERLRSIGVLERLPVIVLTGNPSLLLEERCLTLGARHVMTKPFDLGRLSRWIQAAAAGEVTASR